MQKIQNKIHRAKKSLGQNFLKSEPALRKIVEAGEIIPSDIILEIGPGKGALTEKLLDCASTVIAVEKDRELFNLLQEKFSKEISDKKLILLNEDILEFDVKKIMQVVVLRTLGRSVDDEQRKFSAENFCGEQNNNLHNFSTNYKIIANIPYNITGAILKKFLSEKNQPSMMVLMVQNEVAKRIVARDNKESILSISVKAYGIPKIEMKVPARYFSPAPKVDSAIISIKNISRSFFIENKISEERFWILIHAGFAHKRKKLSSNLKNYIGLAYAMELENKRAEDLTLSDWLLLIKKD
ncbi:MAG: rRNA adenine dimethyltransferase family protein [bacterium]